MRKTLSLLLLLTALASADSLLTGTIQRLEMGDYAHLIVLDGKGKEHSFFVGNDKSFDKLVEAPEKFKGRKVRVHWRSVEKEIPEAGGKMKIDEATSMELLK